MDEGKKNLTDIAGRLRKLHWHLEERKEKGAAWSTARMLEDRIGAGQPTGDDVARAEALLATYRM